jgi:hypothetical protein
MAPDSIPAVVRRAVPALRYLFDIDHYYSEGIADTLESELAAFLRFDGRLYAIWAPHTAPERRIVQPIERTDWSLLDPADLAEKTITLVTIEGDEDEGKRPGIKLAEVPMSTLFPELAKGDCS